MLKLNILFSLGEFVRIWSPTLKGWRLPIMSAIDAIRLATCISPRSFLYGTKPLDRSQTLRLGHIQRYVNKIFPCQCVISDSISDQPMVLGSRWLPGKPILIFPSRFVAPLQPNLDEVEEFAGYIDRLPPDPELIAEKVVNVLPSTSLEPSDRAASIVQYAYSYTDPEIEYLVRLAKEEYDQSIWLTELGRLLISKLLYDALSPSIAEVVGTIAPPITGMVRFVSLSHIENMISLLLSLPLFAAVCFWQDKFFESAIDSTIQDLMPDGYKVAARVRKRECLVDIFSYSIDPSQTRPTADINMLNRLQRLLFAGVWVQNLFRNSIGTLDLFPKSPPTQSIMSVPLRRATRVLVGALGVGQMIRQLGAISRLFRQHL